MVGISLNCSERNFVLPISHVMFFFNINTKFKKKNPNHFTLYFLFAGKDAIYHVAIALVGKGEGGTAIYRLYRYVLL